MKVITTSESQTGGGKRSVHIHSGTPFNNRNLEHAKKEPSFKGADCVKRSGGIREGVACDLTSNTEGSVRVSVHAAL